MKRGMIMKTKTKFVTLLLLAGCFIVQAQQKNPNIVIIWGDDIGQTNISTYSMGIMGYKTPNIDEIALR